MDENITQKRTDSMEKRNLAISILSFLFGFSSWVGITGLWLEIPLMVQQLPEGPNLASNLSVALQAANIACIIYWVIWKFNRSEKTEEISIHVMIAVGTISCFLLIFFWSTTVTLNGSPYSIGLYVLSFGLSIVDTASSITFLPYMGRFKSIYLTPFLAGEGMGGFIPSLVSLAQGVGEQNCYNTTEIFSENVTEINSQNVTEFKIKNITRVVWIPQTPIPRFSEEVFLSSLLILVILSWIAFTVMNHCSFSRKRQSKLILEVKEEIEIHNLDRNEKRGTEEIFNPISQKFQEVSKVKYYYLMSLQFWACLATFGIFPALQPFSCLPYGSSAFHLAVTFSGMAYPAACFIGIFLEIKSMKGITILVAIATGISSFLLVTAILNPNPPLKEATSGKILLVVCWTLFTGLFSYVKTMITIVLSDMGHKVLFKVGAITQVGGFIGSIFMLGIVNWSKIFNEEVCF